MDTAELFKAFELELFKNGFPNEVIWVDVNQIHYSGDTLYIYPCAGFPYQFQVQTVFEKYKDKFGDGATLILVAVNNNQSYCTLLMDSFGSDTDYGAKEVDQNTFIWADKPYVNKAQLVFGRLRWFFVKRKAPRLSSLDYTFSTKQAYA
jgi:hypothetical protein